MEKSERELFKAERVRLDRTQKQVEDKSGIGQGLISRIEVDPTYNPTVAVFKKAVTGIDLTLSTFFAQIEGLPMPNVPAQNRPATPPALIGFDDEALSTLAPKDLLRVVVALAQAYADREREAISREHRGHNPEARNGPAGADHRPRTHRPRTDKGRVKPRPPKD